jgi:uncharacterized protein (DUF305 family)
VTRVPHIAAFLVLALTLGCSSNDEHGHEATGAGPADQSSSQPADGADHAAHDAASVSGDDVASVVPGEPHHPAPAAPAGAAPARAGAAHDHGAAPAAARAVVADEHAAHAAHAAPMQRPAPAPSVSAPPAASRTAAAPPADHAAHAAHAATPAGHDHGVHLPATAGPGYTVADVHFMQMMMAHHAQAVVMSAKARTHGAGEQVLLLAEKIDISQRDEIDMMRQWLRERGQAVPTDEQMLAMHMPGMLTPEQMRQLDGARGRAFDRLFLVLMIEHHIGAMDMVDELFAAPGAAQDSDIFRFATDVAADQGDEIFIMQRMLDTIAASGGGQLQ